jgi:hypothetical protein
VSAVTQDFSEVARRENLHYCLMLFLRISGANKTIAFLSFFLHKKRFFGGNKITGQRESDRTRLSIVLYAPIILLLLQFSLSFSKEEK